jgi:hypothetical protein
MSCRLCQQLSKSTDYSPCTQSLSSLPYSQQHATGTLKTRPTRSSRGIARGGQVVRSPRKTETKGQQRERCKLKKKGGFLLSLHTRKLLSQINRISKEKKNCDLSFAISAGRPLPPYSPPISLHSSLIYWKPNLILSSHPGPKCPKWSLPFKFSS